MNGPSLTATELLAWSEKTGANWRQLLSEHPELLKVPCDIARVKTIGELLQHIVAAQLRYAERLAELPVTEYDEIAFDRVESIYAAHDRGMTILHQLLESNSNVDWGGSIEFVTRRSGPARSSRKTVLFHALLHGIRHYAQLATLVRQQGVTPHWPMDYLFMDIESI
jgi:uncharacterized damage-inducible protein DinB